MSDSKISWTNKTWNPTTGCDQVSPGCDHCYALTLAARLKRMGNPRYQNDGNPKTSGPGFALTLHEDKLDEPLSWKKPARVFVNSMSDLFHDDVPDEFVAHVFGVMIATPRHQFQVLTKRPRRMARLLNDHMWCAKALSFAGCYVDAPTHVPTPWPNIWLGTSVEDQKRADLRIPLLLDTPAAIRFLSCEPLLGPVDLVGDDHKGHDREWNGSGYTCLDCSTEDEEVAWYDVAFPDIDWIIVGGESGPNFRPMDLDWARSIRDQCLAAGVPFFYKQGSGPRSEMHKELDGHIWDYMPDEAQV